MSKHGVSSVRDELLAVLRRIARAATADAYEQCVQQLKAHDLWKSNKALQQWFGNTWLREHKVIITYGTYDNGKNHVLQYLSEPVRR